jgi:hypothetical protein
MANLGIVIDRVAAERKAVVRSHELLDPLPKGFGTRTSCGSEKQLGTRQFREAEFAATTLLQAPDKRPGRLPHQIGPDIRIEAEHGSFKIGDMPAFPGPSRRGEIFPCRSGKSAQVIPCHSCRLLRRLGEVLTCPTGHGDRLALGRRLHLAMGCFIQINGHLSHVAIISLSDRRFKYIRQV